MSLIITEQEILEIRKILNENEGENECIACGLCCKINGKFFINIEQSRISKNYSSELFSKDHGIDIIQATDFIPWCIGGNNQTTLDKLEKNEKNIIKPGINVEEVIFEPSFNKIYCKVYQERPILCRYYPYNSFPYNCMIGIEFYGENPKQVIYFKELMVKYIYTYRLECLRAENFSFNNWKIKSSDQLIYSKNIDNNLITIKHQKALMNQNSIWNIWGYLEELPITQKEKKLIDSFDGSKTLEEIVKNSNESFTDSFLREIIIKYLIFEIIEFPEEFLKILLLGIVRF